MTSAYQALASMRQLVGSGDRSGIVALASVARQDDPTDLCSLVDIAILLRDCGHFDDSASLCKHILLHDQKFVAALYELAMVEAMRGRHVEALLPLERLLVIRPCDERALPFAARMSARLGDYAAAYAYLRRMDEAVPAHPDLPWLRELVAFMEAFPVGVADRLTQLYERDPLYVSADTLAGWAAVALQNGEGFSLIRLGDGEGAFCRISSEDEARYPHIYAYCRRDRSHVWFNGEIDIHKSGFTDTAFSLREAIHNANVVGMPYRTWVEHEYKYCSPTGIVCLVNALRLAQLPSIKHTQSWTTQLVHMDLLQQGIIERLVRQHRHVSLISCLPDAAKVIKKYFELDGVDLYRIPGEKAHAAQLGAETTVGNHYPSRFEELMQELTTPLHGRLFLVAGGLLGKLYCDRIKRSGGVALDIGSVVDVWMGKATRPGANPKFKLKQ